jgi:hypothetical protein
VTRHLKIIEYALSSVLRRKFKSLAIVAAFALAIAAISSVLYLSQSLKAEASLLLETAPELIVQRLSAGRHELVPLKYMDALSDIPGVSEVKPRYWGYYYDAVTEANFTFMGLAEGQETRLELLEGRLPDRSGECAVGKGVYASRVTGDELIVIDSRNMGVIYTVVGVFRDDSSLLTNDLVVLGREDIISFFGFPPDMATDIHVGVYNPNEVQTVAAKVKRLLPDSRPITRSELIRTYEMVFNWRSGMMLTVFSATLLAFCILAWDKATGLSAEERQEIGILKAVGWDTADVLEMKFWEGMVISLTSFLAGTIAGFVHVFFLGAPLLVPVIKGWSVLFPTFRLRPHVDLYTVFVLGFLTVTPYVISTVIPSWKAAITDPEAVMRG